MKYRHLSQEERDRLAVLRSRGETLAEISQALKRSPGTLSRELRRNSSGYRSYYYPHTAQKQAQERWQHSHGGQERLKSLALRQEVERLLEQRWSPQLISG